MNHHPTLIHCNCSCRVIALIALLILFFGGPAVTKAQDTVWVDDALPSGASTGGDESWTWVTSNPSPFAGTSSHQSSASSGAHQHYFFGATATLSISAGDKLFAYVYIDPNNVPSEIMFQWNDGDWNHRAYWGTNNLEFGDDGGASRHYMGSIPATGQWVRLEVGAVQVGLEGRTLNGMAFSLYGGRVTFDAAGKFPQTPINDSWVDDRLPAGSSVAGNEPWNWVTSPNPFSGNYAHESNIVSGFHQHYFQGAMDTLTVSTGEALVAYVYLDPQNTPSEVMLQWNDGSWEHRAYWGADQIETSSTRINKGNLPAAGEWVRLEVPASDVNLENTTINGVAFKLYGGRATWDKVGKTTQQTSNNPPSVSISTNQASYTLPAYVSIAASASDTDGTITKVEFFEGTTQIGQDTSAPYTLTWENVPTGTYTLKAKATDNLGATALSTAVTITVNPIPFPSTPIPCPSPSPITLEGDLQDGHSTSIPISLAPCETVNVAVMTSTQGGAVTLTFHNNVGTTILTDNWSPPGTSHIENIPYDSAPWLPPYRGTRGPEGLPMYAIFESRFADIHYKITVTKTPRQKYNLGGNGFGNALDVTSLPASYYGSLWPYEQGQYFKIHLQGNESVYLSGFALGHWFYSASFQIQIYNSSQQLLTDLVNITPGGRVEYSNVSYTNPSANAADFYLRVTCYEFPIHDFELNIQRDHCTSTAEVKPVAPNASGIGPLAVTSSEYKLPATVDTDVLTPNSETEDLTTWDPANRGREIELWARVYRPSDLSAGPYPLIIFLHGNHATCGRGSNPIIDTDEAPFSSFYSYTGRCLQAGESVQINGATYTSAYNYTVIQNHTGYAYLAEQLASRGYIVVAINANRGINAIQGIISDPSLILTRGRLVLKHLQKLREWNVNGGSLPLLGVDLTGKIDFNNVGLMGHSRGGEGVRAAYSLYKEPGSPWPARIVDEVKIKAIFELAPTDLNANLQTNGTKRTVLLPMCDGDVNDLSGVRPFDRMMITKVDDPPTMKSTYTVWGTNHNFYNTQWQQNEFSTACIGDGNVPLFSEFTIGSQLQQQIASESIVGFFRANIGNSADPSFNQNFDPRYQLPNLVSAFTRVDRGFTPSPKSPITITFDDFDGSATNLCSSPNVCGSNVVSNRGVVPEHDDTLPAALVNWTSAGSNQYFQSTWKTANSSLNVSDFQTLDFRISRQNLTSNPSVATNFSIQLITGDNSPSGSVPLCKYFGNLRGPVGGLRVINGVMEEKYHSILETVRIPLSEFTGANLTQVKGVRFIFDATPTGAIYIANIRFAK